MVSRFEQFSGAVSCIYRCIQKIERVEMAKFGLKGPHAQCMLAMSRYPEGLTAGQLCELCDKDKALIEKAGHGGGDFFVIREFFRCIREGVQHPFDVYFATTMASVAILGHRSLLAGGAPYDIPDFSKEEDKRLWENDRISPFPDENGNVDVRCSSIPYGPSAEDMANAEKKWNGQ